MHYKIASAKCRPFSYEHWVTWKPANVYAALMGLKAIIDVDEVHVEPLIVYTNKVHSVM